MHIDYVSVGKRIRELRIKQGLTQNKLAEKSGIEPSNISHIERAATKLSLPTLVSIANALNVSVDEIIYKSLVKNCHVTHQIIDDMLSDCSSNEIDAISELIKVAKKVLRENKE